MKRTIPIFSVLFLSLPLMGMGTEKDSSDQVPSKKLVTILGKFGRVAKTVIEHVIDAKKYPQGNPFVATKCFRYENDTFTFLGNVLALSQVDEKLIDGEKLVFIGHFTEGVAATLQDNYGRVASKIYQPIAALIIGTADEGMVMSALPALKKLIETEKENNNK